MVQYITSFFHLNYFRMYLLKHNHLHPLWDTRQQQSLSSYLRPALCSMLCVALFRVHVHVYMYLTKLSQDTLVLGGLLLTRFSFTRWCLTLGTLVIRT